MTDEDMELDELSFHDMDMGLNTDWIEKFENIDDMYSMFYKDDNEIINVTFVFVNKCNEIERVKNEQFILPEKNKIPTSSLMDLVMTNKPTNYSLYFMLKYNITIEPEDVKYVATRSRDYLTQINKIQDIYFERTITMFQDLNELTIFFIEKSQKRNKTSKLRVLDKYKKHKMTMKQR